LPLVLLVQLASEISTCKFSAIRNPPLNGRCGVHPCLANAYHKIAMARVVREFGPTQAIEREQAHLVRGDHGYAAVRASSNTRSRNALASMTPELARSMMRVAIT